MQTTLLLVTGMHRSGTSALAELLHRRGARVASKQLPEQAAINARGFWEDVRMVEFNEQILAAGGSLWYELSPLEDKGSGHRPDPPIRAQALGYLRNTYSSRELSLCKDPRFCRTLPFWLPLFGELSIRLAPVIMLRHPSEVAASLQARDAFPPQYTCLLWLVYYRDLLHSVAGLDAVLIDYDELLRNPQACVERVSSSFELVWPVELENSTVDADLRHHHATEYSLDTRVEPGATVAWLYEELRTRSLLDRSTCQRCLAHIDRELGEYSDWRRGVSILARRVVADQSELQDIGARHSRAMAVVEEKDAELHKLAGQWEEARRTIVEKDRQLTDLAAHWEKARSTIEEKDRQLTDLAAHWAKAGSTIEEKDRKLSELSQLWQTACSSIEEKDADLARIVAELEYAREVVAARDKQVVELKWLMKGWLGLPNRLRRKWRR